MTARKILLINSEPTLREVMQDCLSQLGGWQVTSTGSPSEGLRQVQQSRPDAIVIDLSKTDLDSLAFLSDLQAQLEPQTVPVVLITAGAKWLDFRKLRQFQVVGAIDYLPDPAQLPQVIARLLGW